MKNKEIVYKKAKKRVKEVKNYFYFLAVYIVISGLLFFKKSRNDEFFFTENNTFFYLIVTQGFLLIAYGIYLFVPFFNRWEERKTNELMNKYLKNKPENGTAK